MEVYSKKESVNDLNSVVSVLQSRGETKKIASQMGSFNSLTPAHLTSKPHVSCKTLHLLPHAAAPTSSGLLLNEFCLPLWAYNIAVTSGC